MCNSIVVRRECYSLAQLQLRGPQTRQALHGAREMLARRGDKWQCCGEHPGEFVRKTRHRRAKQPAV